MTENFPNLVKKIDIQVQKTQRVPNKMKPKRSTPRYIIVKMPNIKDKKRLLKAAREKELITYNKSPIRLSADFLQNFKGEELAWHIHSNDTAKITAKITLPSKAII